MKVLTTSAIAQTLKFIPREYPSTVNYTITPESTGTSVSDTGVTATTNGAYLQITEVFTLLEGNYYNIDITKTDNTLIYRTKIFCTDQTISDYLMDGTDYTEHTGGGNEYVIMD